MPYPIKGFWPGSNCPEDFTWHGSFLLGLARLNLADELELTDKIEIALAQNLIA